MTSGIVTVGIIVGVFFIGIFGGFVISQNTNNLQPMMNNQMMQDMMNSNKENSKSIHMGMSTFMPNQLEIKPNTKVVWTAHDMETHNVNGIFKTDSGKEIPILSGDVEHMQGWSYTFDEPGIFEYVCGYHEGMEGMLIVS